MKVRRIDRNDDWTFGQGHANYADGSESTSQRVRTRLQSFLGDWFLDLSYGMPWLDDFERPANLSDLERAARITILQTSGVAQLDELDLVLDPSRLLVMTASIQSSDGDADQITAIQ